MSGRKLTKQEYRSLQRKQRRAARLPPDMRERELAGLGEAAVRAASPVVDHSQGHELQRIFAPQEAGGADSTEREQEQEKHPFADHTRFYHRLGADDTYGEAALRASVATRGTGRYFLVRRSNGSTSDAVPPRALWPQCPLPTL